MHKTFLKFLFTIGLCYWLFKNEKVDFGLITQAFHLGYLWIWGLLLILSRPFVCALRFKTLLDTQSETRSPFLKVLSFDAIGNLFSVLLTGTTAGDVTRFFYYKDLNSKLTPGTLVSLLTLDRTIGLLGLMGLGSLVTLFQFQEVALLSHELKLLITLNIIVFIILGFFLILICSKIIPQEKIAEAISQLFKSRPKLQSFFKDLLSIHLKFIPFIKCFFLSMMNHSMTIIGFYLLIHPFIPNHVSFFKIFTILPIGFIGSSLPISPAGLGVGHVLFDNLFKLIQIDHGASLFNLYFAANIVMCLVGIIPYLYYKK